MESKIEKITKEQAELLRDDSVDSDDGSDPYAELAKQAEKTAQKSKLDSLASTIVENHQQISRVERRIKQALIVLFFAVCLWFNRGLF